VNDVQLTPWFALIAEKFLFPWWEQLISQGGTSGLQEDGLIHHL
jgi:hypothetical protein